MDVHGIGALVLGAVLGASAWATGLWLWRRRRARGAAAPRDGAAGTPRPLEPSLLEGLGSMAGGVAHEFNALIAGILGDAHLASLERSTPTPVLRHLARIEDAGKRAGRLVHKLMAMAGHAPPRSRRMRLSQVVHDALETVPLPEYVDLDEHTGRAPVSARVDPRQVRFVVRHLVQNAVEAVPEGTRGRVTVRTGERVYARSELRRARAGSASLPAGPYAYIEVSDSGAGMDTDTAMRMFDPFFSTRHPGRGLGLSAVYGIVRRHGGGMYVNSTVGRGTVVRVVLPTDAQPQAPRPRSLPPASPTGTVLLIEQDEPVQAYVRAVLQRRGVRVLTASDGVDGLAKYAQRVGTLDVVLLDATLRSPSAKAVLHDIRARNPKQAVVLLGPPGPTGVPTDPGGGRTRRLTKPFKVDALLRAVDPWARVRGEP